MNLDDRIVEFRVEDGEKQRKKIKIAGQSYMIKEYTSGQGEVATTVWSRVSFDIGNDKLFSG